MDGTRILIVEDDALLAEALCLTLRREGHEVAVAPDGPDGLVQAEEQVPDLILLDLTLPSLDGLEVCRRLRAARETCATPIILLTGRTDEAAQVAGLSAGADDYVIKPFSLPVLLERVKALQRRLAAQAPPAERAALPAPPVAPSLRLDPAARRVFVGGHAARLTPTEFRLLECLLRDPGRAFTRQELLRAAGRTGRRTQERTVDVHIQGLRRKLGSYRLIESVYGIGYRLDSEKMKEEG
jgi:two-component system phosphate regulon response regulator PhoB